MNGGLAASATHLDPIAIAFIWHRNTLLLQLRDFSPSIADPGQWGFLGGHVEAQESPADALRRELAEEIDWSPAELLFLGSFEAHPERRLMFGFQAVCHDLAGLSLREGQELGRFDPHDLRQGFAYSARWRREFPVTSITARALSLWSDVRIPPAASIK